MSVIINNNNIHKWQFVKQISSSYNGAEDLIMYKCPNCDKRYVFNINLDNDIYKYCPNCGYKLDGIDSINGIEDFEPHNDIKDDEKFEF